MINDVYFYYAGKTLINEKMMIFLFQKKKTKNLCKDHMATVWFLYRIESKKQNRNNFTLSRIK